jgi:hypothetical protein
MNWFDKMEIAYEAQTDRMIDEMYAPKPVECAMCEEYFCSGETLETKYNLKLFFCSEECMDQWEEEYAKEIEEGEWNNLDNQFPIFPTNWTSIQSTIHKAG